MKVTSKQMIAIVKVMMDIMHSDGMEEVEGVYVVNFLRQFKMDDDKMTEIIRASKQMDKDTAYELINGLDQSAKQELSNYLGGLILTDGDVSDEESVILFEMLGYCGIPLPDTQEWEEWVNSNYPAEAWNLEITDNQVICNGTPIKTAQRVPVLPSDTIIASHSYQLY